MAAQPVRLPQKARSKYHATPTVVDGIRFHSAREAARYGELKLLEKAGQIRGLTLQPRFPLTVARQSVTDLQSEPPETIGEFRSDFRYDEFHHGAWVDMVEEVKGFETPLYRWKRRHFEAQYAIDLRVTR